jgi:hypothetical protein
MTESVNTLNDPPTPMARVGIAIGLLLFLVIQIVIPISYYFGSEPTSERFAWRMFSSIHMSKWDTKIVAVLEKDGATVERQVPLSPLIQETYVNAINAAQLDIVEPLLRSIAKQPGIREVRFEANGTYPSGKPMKPIRMGLRPGGDLRDLSESTTSKG